jgi:hypothetical protein
MDVDEWTADVGLGPPDMDDLWIERVISGGQAGADQGGLRSARACGIATGGWAPCDWLPEAGPTPWLANWGLAECPEGETEAERYRLQRMRPGGQATTRAKDGLAERLRSWSMDNSCPQ